MREIELARIRFVLAWLILWPVASGGAAVTTSSETFSGVGIERGVTRLRCPSQHGNAWLRTRAIIVDTGTDAAREVLLAPAHGLPAGAEAITKRCLVESGLGSTGRIAEVWLPERRDEAGSGDWAVLITRARFRGEIHRLRVGMVSAPSLAKLIADEAPISLMMHSLVADQNHCRILGAGLRSRRQSASGVFLHSCRTWPGVSGAPIVARFDGRPVVIGFNSGRLIRPLDHEGPLYLGVGRVIDAEIASAIRRATKRARH